MANVYLNAKLTPSSQASTALYSCPDFKTGVLKSILACNPSSGALSVTITLGSSFCLMQNRSPLTKRLNF